MLTAYFVQGSIQTNQFKKILHFSLIRQVSACASNTSLKEMGPLQCLLGNAISTFQWPSMYRDRDTTDTLCRHVEMLGQQAEPANKILRQPPASLRTFAAAQSLGDSRTGQHGSAFLLS